jgi:hypothetical protein
MGETALVEAKVSDAVQLIHKLDALDKSPTTAAWYFYDDADEWRFLIAGPAFDALLPKQEAVAYRTTIEAMNSLSLSSLGVSDLKLIETKTPLIHSLRQLIGTATNSIVRAHFSNTTLNGIFIKEMIIMRSAS